jgi:membrane protease YdiL (CAAX protease family)
MSIFDPIPEPSLSPEPLEGIRPATPEELTRRPREPFAFPGERPGLPHPGLLWSFIWSFVFLLLTQIPGAIIAVVVLLLLTIIAPQTLPEGSMGNPTDLMKSPAMNISMAVAFFVTEILVIGVSWLALRIFNGRDWKRKVALTPPALSHVALALAGLPALIILANVSYDLIKQVIPSMDKMVGMPGMEQMVGMFSTWPWPFAVLVIGIGPGIGEELWCRGFLGRGLVARYGVWVGVLFTSFFFGLIHVDPCQGLMAMLMGLCLHYAYLMTRSLWVPMLLHFLNNAVSVVASRFTFLDTLDAKPETLPVPLLVSVIVLLVWVGLALYQCRARVVGPGSGPRLWQAGYPGVEEPPPESGLVVVRPRPSLLATALVLVALVAFLFFFCRTVMNA